MTLLTLRRTSISVGAALAALCVSAAPALASVTDGTSNTIQVAAATSHHVASSAGTQVGSEGIIAILIGLRH